MSAPVAAPAVPCLAAMYAALGADEPATAAPATPRHRRIAAGLAAGALALSLTVWPGAPVHLAADLPGAADRPAATLPEWPDLLADLDG